MPRHRPNAATSSSSPTAPQAMPGGAAGVPEADVLSPTGTNNPYASQGSAAGRPPPPAPDEFMITDGPRMENGKIRYNANGYLSHLAPGKIVSAGAFDLDGMRAQGIKLEPMPKVVEVPVEDDEPEAEPAALEA